MWQLKTVVFPHSCLICVVLLGFILVQKRIKMTFLMRIGFNKCEAKQGKKEDVTFGRLERGNSNN
jgi:hypothetical protein